MSTLHDSARISIAPGSVIIVRDEEWLVTGVEHTTDGRLLRCQGLSELVRDTTASFYEGLDADLRVLDPAEASVLADDSPHYLRSRLWLESTLRKTAVPLDGTALTVSGDMLADPLGYQQAVVRKALDQANLRTRMLLADAAPCCPLSPSARSPCSRDRATSAEMIRRNHRAHRARPHQDAGPFAVDDAARRRR